MVYLELLHRKQTSSGEGKRMIAWQVKNCPGRSPGEGNGNPVYLPGKSHGQRSLVGYSPWDCKRMGHDFSTELTCASYFNMDPINERNPDKF